MFIDVVNAGWIPIYNLNLSDDVIGYTGAPAIALDYPWTHLISGHLGRVATREDVALHHSTSPTSKQLTRGAGLGQPGPIFKHYGENVWAPVKAHLDAVTEHAARPRHRENTPACWVSRHRDFHQDHDVLRSCSQFASTAAPAARSIPDRNAPRHRASAAQRRQGERHVCGRTLRRSRSFG